MLAKVLLDANPQGHATGWAADTGSVQPNSDKAIFCNVDEFDVSSVILHRWPDEVEDANDAIMEW